jgi:hypothetical protein
VIQPRPPSITVAKVERRDITASVLVSGNVVARDEVMVVPEVDGLAVQEILAEVEADLAKAYEESQDLLAKAAGDEQMPEEGSSPAPEASSSPSTPAEASSSGSNGSAFEAPSASALAPEASSSSSAEGSSGSEKGSAPEMAPEGHEEAPEEGGEMTPEALQAEYSKLPPEELDMHIQAALAAKAALSGQAPAGAPPVAAPEAAPPAMPPMAMKSEASASQEGLSKAEDKIKSLEEDIQNLTKALKMVVEQPVRKAITSVAYMAKSEEVKEVTPAMAHAKLKELSARPDLKKSERQLIMDFYEGRIKADKLAPLFESYK